VSRGLLFGECLSGECTTEVYELQTSLLKKFKNVSSDGSPLLGHLLHGKEMKKLKFPAFSSKD
jgi:hypothetical protein